MARREIQRLECIPFSPPENKQGCRRQAEGNEIDGDHVVQYLLVASREGNHGRGHTLQDDSHDRNSGAGRKPAHTFEEEAVPRHGVVDPRSGQNPLAEKAQRGNGDAECNPLRASLT